MIWIIIILGLAADMVTKRWAFDQLRPGRVVDLIPGYLDLSYLENRGAAFGIFQGQARLLGIASAAVALGIFFYLIRNKKMHNLMKAALALIVTGALGNVIDRLRYGFVVDFIHFHLKDAWHFPTFNVADICVSVGAGLMILYILFFDEDDKESRRVS